MIPYPPSESKGPFGAFFKIRYFLDAFFGILTSFQPFIVIYHNKSLPGQSSVKFKTSSGKGEPGPFFVQLYKSDDGSCETGKLRYNR